MRLAYERLFRIRLRHSFYADASGERSFRLEPSPWSWRVLRAQGLLFRQEPDGGSVCVELEPGSSPPAPLRPLGDLRLQFLLFSSDRHAASITDLPAHSPGQAAFYFNNLTDDQTEGRLHLVDAEAPPRVREALRLVPGSVLEYVPLVARPHVGLSVSDLFGNTLLEREFDAPEGLREVRLDLGPAQLSPGYYVARDDQGKVLRFFHGAELALVRPFGLVEVFADTVPWTPDGQNRVPMDYRFLDAGQLIVGREYTLQFEARPTTWRYVVLKKYTSNDQIRLAGLSIKGPVDFKKTLLSDRALFESKAPVALGETGPELTLQQGDDPVLALPRPQLSTPLSAGASRGAHASEMFVYV